MVHVLTDSTELNGVTTVVSYSGARMDRQHEWDGATTVVSYSGARMDRQHGVGWRNDCSEL